MSCKQAKIDFLVMQMKEAGNIRAKKMFGEYGIYCDEKIVALVCDDQLFVKPTQAGEEFIGEVLEGFPYPRAKPYFLITEKMWKDKNWVAELIRLTAAELPSPKKKF